jgi:hypothetical protein
MKFDLNLICNNTAVTATHHDNVDVDANADAGTVEPINASTSASPPLHASLALSGDDLLWGVAAIATAINRTRRQTFHMLEKSKLPAAKIGGRWCASRSGLRRFFSNAMTGGADELTR